MSLRVAVVGAGLSGLTAARELRSAGRSVTVFDKGRRPGGRANTREHGSRRYDHGAQYFTVRDEAVEPWLASWNESGLVTEWEGRLVRVDDDGVTPAKEARRYVAVPGMVELALHLAAPLEVRCGVRVGGVRRTGTTWILEDDEGGTLGSFHRVVVAVPAPQALPLLADAPSLCAEAEKAVMEPCWAAMISFGERARVDFDGAFIRGAPVSWAARNSSKPGRPAEEAWVAHFTPGWTRDHWDDEEDDVCRHALDVLRKSLGYFPDPVHARAHRWGYALASEGPEHILYEPRLGIGACGDWCVGGRVEGALLSGLEIARRMDLD